MQARASPELIVHDDELALVVEKRFPVLAFVARVEGVLDAQHAVHPAATRRGRLSQSFRAFGAGSAGMLTQTQRSISC